MGTWLQIDDNSRNQAMNQSEKNDDRLRLMRYYVRLVSITGVIIDKRQVVSGTAHARHDNHQFHGHDSFGPGHVSRWRRHLGDFLHRFAEAVEPLLNPILHLKLNVDP